MAFWAHIKALPPFQVIAIYLVAFIYKIRYFISVRNLVNCALIIYNFSHSVTNFSVHLTLLKYIIIKVSQVLVFASQIVIHFSQILVSISEVWTARKQGNTMANGLSRASSILQPPRIIGPSNLVLTEFRQDLQRAKDLQWRIYFVSNIVQLNIRKLYILIRASHVSFKQRMLEDNSGHLWVNWVNNITHNVSWLNNSGGKADEYFDNANKLFASMKREVSLCRENLLKVAEFTKLLKRRLMNFKGYLGLWYYAEGGRFAEKQIRKYVKQLDGLTSIQQVLSGFMCISEEFKHQFFLCCNIRMVNHESMEVINTSWDYISAQIGDYRLRIAHPDIVKHGMREKEVRKTSKKVKQHLEQMLYIVNSNEKLENKVRKQEVDHMWMAVMALISNHFREAHRPIEEEEQA